MSARDIAEHTFEIILTMEGITPETGNTVQVTQRYQCCGTFCNNLSSFIQNDRSKLLLNQKAAFMRVVMQEMENVKDLGFPQKRWKGRITWGTWNLHHSQHSCWISCRCGPPTCQMRYYGATGLIYIFIIYIILYDKIYNDHIKE